MGYDYLIVGAGLFGSIFAYEANKCGKKVLVIDSRDHIGGNCYSEKFEDYDIHKYGPHIFHTSQKYIWDYINKFTSFNNFTLRNKAFYKNKIYSLPINLTTISQIYNVNTPQAAREVIEKVKIPCENPDNLEDYILSIVGPEIYNILIKGYTKKQWGKDPKNLPASIIKRLPIRFDMNDRYFPNNDIYEGIPSNGYTEIFNNMLDGISVSLSTDYFSDKSYFDNLAKKIVYSGPIDRYFDYMYGDLEYRSLRHETILNKGDFQGTALVNYTDETIPYTRIIQHKHFLFNNNDNDTVTFEFPLNYKRGGQPYYPINDHTNNNKYKLYKEEANKIDNLIIGGRLGNYRYYDMDMTIGNALSVVKKELSNIGIEKKIYASRSINCS
jgi:UDP-galactopyranose mutase